MTTRRFPPGFRFLPTDTELLEYNLKKRNSSFLFPHVPIYDCNIYDFSPDDLASMYGVGENEEMYFFAEREPVTACGSRPSRTAAGGLRRSDRTYEVCDKEDRMIGLRMSLKFFKSKKEPSNWLMDEYKILEGDEAMTPDREMKRRKTSGNLNFNLRLKMDGFVLRRIQRRGNREEANSNIQSTHLHEANSHDSQRAPIHAAQEVSEATQSYDPVVIDPEELLNPPEECQAPQSNDPIVIDPEELLHPPEDPQAPETNDIFIDLEELLNPPEDFIDLEELLNPPEDFIDLEELLNPPEDSQAQQSNDIVIDLEELLNPLEDSRARQAHDSGADIEELLGSLADSNAPQYDDFDAYAEIDIVELLNSIN